MEDMEPEYPERHLVVQLLLWDGILCRLGYRRRQRLLHQRT